MTVYIYVYTFYITSGNMWLRKKPLFLWKSTSRTHVAGSNGGSPVQKWAQTKPLIFEAELSKKADVYTYTHFFVTSCNRWTRKKSLFLGKYTLCTPVTGPPDVHPGKKWAQSKPVIFGVKMSKNTGVHTHAHTFYILV